MKPLNLPIIEDADKPRHDCAGHCSGDNGRDGFCYHADGTRHPVGVCRSNAKKRAAVSPGVVK